MINPFPSLFLWRGEGLLLFFNLSQRNKNQAFQKNVLMQKRFYLFVSFLAICVYYTYSTYVLTCKLIKLNDCVYWL